MDPPKGELAGLIWVTVTGPITHQSPLMNWPVGRSSEKVHVIPH
jgi:hypothetical protein